jgi:3-oxoacyl-[acyl-carrier-protein] synthase II
VSARQRVAITGVGAVTAVVSGGASAVSEAIGSAAVTDGERVDRTLASLVDRAEARRLSRVCQLTLAAARLAVADAGLAAGADLGLVVGTELGDLRSTIAFADGYLSRGPSGLSPLLFPNTVMNAMASSTAIALAARDVSLTIAAPTIAGELAIARAATAVASGRAAAVLAGGVDELDPAVAAVLAEVRAALGGRGEGAAFLVLERLDDATARGARVLGEVLGTASGGLPAAPHGIGRRGTSSVVPRALADAGLAAGAVRTVLTGENGDEPRDAWEARVLKAEAIEAPHGPAVARRFGQGSAVGPLKVAAATSRAPALVHGLARGGSHVALVIGPAPAACA